MKHLLLLTLMLLSGCSTVVPMVPDFPDSPPSLMEKCPPLKRIDSSETSLSNLTKTIVENYSLYHQCALKVEEWQKWHQEQKKIFDDIE